MFYIGIVENNDDPLKLGRLQIRVLGIHTENRSQVGTPTQLLLTEELPWAIPSCPINNSSIDGISDFTGLVAGTKVFVFFLDRFKQKPVYFGVMPFVLDNLPNYEQGFSDPSGQYPNEEFKKDLFSWVNEKQLIVKEKEKTLKFEKPTLKEVSCYCNERNNGINSESFINYYDSKGWMIGKNKMKDWKAAVRTWEQNTNKTEQQKNKIEITDETNEKSLKERLDSHKNKIYKMEREMFEIKKADFEQNQSLTKEIEQLKKTICNLNDFILNQKETKQKKWYQLFKK
jgi:hypothetical protein